VSWAGLLGELLAEAVDELGSGDCGFVFMVAFVLIPA